MKKTIDFKNPENVSELNLTELYEQLLLLRDDPEEFKKAEIRIKEVFKEEQIKAGANPKSFETLQATIDKIVAKSEDSFQGAANVFTLMARSFSRGVTEHLNQREIKKAIDEADLASIQ